MVFNFVFEILANGLSQSLEKPPLDFFPFNFGGFAEATPASSSSNKSPSDTASDSTGNGRPFFFPFLSLDFEWGVANESTPVKNVRHQRIETEIIQTNWVTHL